MTLPLRTGSNPRSTVSVRTRAIFRISSSSAESRNFFSRRSSDILSRYAWSAASFWLSAAISRSVLSRCSVALSSLLFWSWLSQKAPMASITGMMRSCSQSQSVFPGWLCIVVVTFVVRGGDNVVSVAVDFTVYPLKPVPLDKTTAIINIMSAMSSTRMPIAMNGCCRIFCHHEWNLDFCHHILNFEVILVPHFCPKAELAALRLVAALPLCPIFTCTSVLGPIEVTPSMKKCLLVSEKCSNSRHLTELRALLSVV